MMSRGRPRTVSLSPAEMINLGKEMVAWVQENNPIHLSQWYSLKKRFTYNQWKTIKVCPDFFPYYEEALHLIGLNYLRKDSQVDPSLKQRWQRVYFKDLRDQEDEDLKYKSDLAKEVEGSKQTHYNIMVPHGLGTGTNVQASPLPNPPDQSS